MININEVIETNDMIEKENLGSWVAALASSAPTPGGGGAAALSGALEILADADLRIKQNGADGRTVLEVTVLRLIELLRREKA